jgi:hypothetical protein
VRGEFRSEPASKADQRHFGRRKVGAAAAAAGKRTVADKEKDAAVFVLNHRADQRARQVKRAVEDDAADEFPIRVGEFGKGLVRPDRGVVDQDVDAPELGQRLRRHRLNLILLGHIGDDADRLDPEILRLAHHAIELLLVGARIDDNVRAFSSQFQHRRAADIAAGAGDQRDLSLKPAHASPPLLLRRVADLAEIGHVAG